MTDFPSVTGLSLRAPAAADQAFLDLLYASTRDDLRHAGLDPAMLAALIAMQQRIHEQGHCKAYPHARHALLEAGGEPIGRFVLDTDRRLGLRLLDIAVLPHARRRGHGGAVLRALQQQARSLGLPLRLRVAGTNDGARRFYVALGFALECEAAADGADELVWRAA